MTFKERATNHRVMLRAMITGVACWEPWEDGKRGEVCFDGLRHSVHLDQDGCPILPASLANQLSEASL